jgi:predicted RNase H-like nuclease (RuvC/YqgF family)
MLANASQHALDVERVGHARDRAKEAERRTDDYRAMYLDMCSSVDELHDRNDEIQAELDAAKRENAELRSRLSSVEENALRLKELLRQWMISEIAFKNLFKKHARMPDGRTIDEMSAEERVKLVQAERENAKQDEQLQWN